MLKTKGVPFRFKAVEESGAFEGYASVFNTVDLYGDKVVPGAFAASLAKHAEAGTRPSMLWQHDQSLPIGVWTEVKEDQRGLFVAGRLLLGVAKAAEAHLLMKAEAIRGLSIGYQVEESDREGNVTLLKSVDLWEISLATFPVNREAGVTAVKSAARFEEFSRRLRDGAPPETKEFEKLLREAGFPKAMAAQIASVGYAKAIRSESGGKASEDALRALREAARAFA